MFEEEELRLQILVRNTMNTVVWRSDDDTFMRVEYVREVRKGEGEAPEEPEPGLCAILHNGTYIALYNVELTEFFFIRRILE